MHTLDNILIANNDIARFRAAEADYPTSCGYCSEDRLRCFTDIHTNERVYGYSYAGAHNERVRLPGMGWPGKIVMTLLGNSIISALTVLYHLGALLGNLGRMIGYRIAAHFVDKDTAVEYRERAGEHNCFLWNNLKNILYHTVRACPLGGLYTRAYDNCVMRREDQELENYGQAQAQWIRERSPEPPEQTSGMDVAAQAERAAAQFIALVAEDQERKRKKAQQNS